MLDALVVGKPDIAPVKVLQQTEDSLRYFYGQGLDK